VRQQAADGALNVDKRIVYDDAPTVKGERKRRTSDNAKSHGRWVEVVKSLRGRKTRSEDKTSVFKERETPGRWLLSLTILAGAEQRQLGANRSQDSRRGHRCANVKNSRMLAVPGRLQCGPSTTQSMLFAHWTVIRWTTGFWWDSCSWSKGCRAERRAVSQEPKLGSPLSVVSPHPHSALSLSHHPTRPLQSTACSSPGRSWTNTNLRPTFSFTGWRDEPIDPALYIAQQHYPVLST
jgi:hypothetical protein